MQVNKQTNFSNLHLISDSSRYEVTITCDSDEINQAKKLRLNGYSKSIAKESGSKKDINVTKKLIEQHKMLIHDGYDSYAQHLIVKDLSCSKVVAYVRIIDAFTAFKIGGFYSETKFNIKTLLNEQQYLIEISRLAIDKDYNNEYIAQLLWSGIELYALNNGFDAVIGCLSVSLNEQSNEFGELISYYKSKFMSQSQLRVTPYQILPDNKPFNPSLFTLSSSEKRSNLAYIDYLFSKGVSLCGDGHWNKTFNTAELFIHYKLSNTQQVPSCIHESEVELGLLCV